MAQVLGIRKQPAAVQETIALNDTQVSVDQARFNFEAKMFALQAEFRERSDKLKAEYHDQLAGITSGE
jgi:hypothetical protein